MSSSWSATWGVAAVTVAMLAMGACAVTENGTMTPKSVGAGLKLRIDWDATQSKDSEKRFRAKDGDNNELKDEGIPRCTQGDADSGVCGKDHAGYPKKKDGSGEYLGSLTHGTPDTLNIYTDEQSPGQTCVCYGSRCYCH